MLQKMEAKFNKEPAFAQAYQDFMREYSQLTHMSQARDDVPGPSYYLPHHGVLKERQHHHQAASDIQRVARNDVWAILERYADGGDRICCLAFTNCCCAGVSSVSASLPT